MIQVVETFTDGEEGEGVPTPREYLNFIKEFLKHILPVKKFHNFLRTFSP